MKRSHVIGVVIYVLMMVLGGSLVVLHDGLDDEGVPNLPYFNERANACYWGASLAGTCVSDADWQCGWAWIRLENGMIDRETFPDACTTLLREPEQE